MARMIYRGKRWRVALFHYTIQYRFAWKNKAFSFWRFRVVRLSDAALFNIKKNET